jgi:hypothetical protein
MRLAVLGMGRMGHAVAEGRSQVALRAPMAAEHAASGGLSSLSTPHLERIQLRLRHFVRQPRVKAPKEGIWAVTPRCPYIDPSDEEIVPR